MEITLVKVGLPVSCRKCGAKGFVKPGSDYAGWYKSRLFKGRLRWYCPEHYEIGKAVDERFSEVHVVMSVDTTEEELYKLLD